MRAGSPLGLITEVLMSTAGMRHGEPRERLRDKIRARVARHVPEAEREHTTMFLGELTGAEFDDSSFLPLRTARSDAMVMADNVRRAWEQFVRAECAAHPLLLVYDDLQWGDAATVSFTDSALRNLGEHPMMVLALARPEVHEVFPGLWSERGMQEIKLMPLSRKASEKLAREALGPSVSAPVIAQVVERAAGNAFFLEELIRAAAEGKSDEVPVSVLAVVEQRLLSLDAEARRVLRAASVFGRTFWGGGVRALLGGSDPGEWLRVLAGAEIVQPRRESRFEGEVEHAFRHDVVREAAYAMLTEADRVLGHRLAAEWLERAGERDALLVAEHFEKGGERARAASWFLRAAEQAFEGNDLAAALARAERGAACGAEGETLGALRRLQAEVHAWTGENEATLRRGREAMEHVPPGAPGWFDAARLAILAAAARLGRAADAVSLAAALEAVTEVPPDAASARACALWSAAWYLLYVGERDRAARLASCVGETEDLGAQAFRADYQAYSALLAGDVGAALDAYSRAQALCERAGDKRRACSALVNVGYAQALLGDDAGAEATLRRALGEARTMGLRHIEATALQNLGPVLARLGRTEEAARVLREAIEAFAAQGDKRMEGGARTYLAEILLAAGDSKAARAEALRAVELFASAPPPRPVALAVLARAERRAGDVARARARAEEAMQEVARVQEGEATIRLEYAEALHAAGDHAAAARAIAEARERLLARAARISDPAWRESFLTRVPEHARTLALAAQWVPNG
jgi:tetratricopeptide (TPR) repeat protein